jgi:hypothetical protein
MDAGTAITEHQWATWAYTVALLALPYPAGLVFGGLTETIAAPSERLPDSVRSLGWGRALLASRERFQQSALKESPEG